MPVVLPEASISWASSEVAISIAELIVDTWLDKLLTRTYWALT